MANILIASKKYDVHSIAIAQTLKEEGHYVFRWIGANFPEKQRLSFSISCGVKHRISIHEYSTTLIESEMDVVWLRRPTWALAPTYLHSDDCDLVKQESDIFIRSIWQTAFDRATWINSLEARRAANSKLLQLTLAVEAGLTIPNTLISNEPDEIIDFIKRMNGSVIVKPLMGGGVRDNDGQLRRTFTARIKPHELPSHQYIQACPCIYQEEIVKAYEVRATFFGATVVVTKIDSQCSINTEIDWRGGFDKGFSLHEIEMPDIIYRKCRYLMSKLSIIYGAFDFAVTPDGEWIFFEVNEAGQFLWIESINPAINILDIATKFMCNPSFNFEYRADSAIWKLSDVYSSSAYQAAYKNDDAYNDDSVALSASP